MLRSTVAVAVCVGVVLIAGGQPAPPGAEPDTRTVVPGRGQRPRVQRLPPAAARIVDARIGKPGRHTVMTGDLVEIEYTFPSDLEPRDVSFRLSRGGSVRAATVPAWEVLPASARRGAMVFHFDAVRPGEETLTLVIDGIEYGYTIGVTDPL